MLITTHKYKYCHTDVNPNPNPNPNPNYLLKMWCACNTNRAGTICHSCPYEGCIDCIDPESKVCWKCEYEIERGIKNNTKKAKKCIMADFSSVHKTTEENKN